MPLQYYGAPGDAYGAVGDVWGETPSPPAPPPPYTPIPEIDLTGGSRVDLFRYDLLDSSLNLVGGINPVVTIDGSVCAPSIRASIQGNAYRVMDSLVLTPEDATRIDPRLNRIRPNWVDVNGDVYPLGVYRVVDTSVIQFSGGDHIEATCADESAVHHSPTTRSLTWTRDTLVADIIDQLAGVLNVPVTDADPTTAVLGEPLGYPQGSTDWFDVYTAVAAAAGMLPPYYTLEGVWRWRTAPDWASAPPDHTFSTDLTAPQSQQRVVESSLVRSVTLFDSPNEFRAYNPAARGAPIVGVYRLPASAPNSVERTGVVVAAYTEVAGLATQAAADAAARASAAAAMDDVGSAQMSTPLDARIDLFSTFSADGLLYRTVGYSARLMPGEQQQHDLRRIYAEGDEEGPFFGGLI